MLTTVTFNQKLTTAPTWSMFVWDYATRGCETLYPITDIGFYEPQEKKASVYANITLYGLRRMHKQLVFSPRGPTL